MNQSAEDKLCRLQPQRENLGVHVDSAIGRWQGEVSAMGIELDFDVRGEMNSILSQVLIYLLLAVELSGLLVKIHADSGSKLGSLPFFLCHNLALARTADSASFVSLSHL